MRAASVAKPALLIALLATSFASAGIPAGVNFSQLGVFVQVKPDCEDSSVNSGYADEKWSYRLSCSDVTIEVNDDQLRVDGQPYGTVTRGDRVIVEAGRVTVNDEPRTAR
jgi:hypothetical protein